MSGYLGRVLRSTVRNEHRLRPLAGSIFGERGGAPTFAGDVGPGEMAKSGDESDLRETERTVVSQATSARNVKSHPEEPMDYSEDYEPLQPPRRGRETRRSDSAERRDLLRADPQENDERHFVRRVQRLGEELRAAMRPGADSDSMRAPEMRAPDRTAPEASPARTTQEDRVTWDTANLPEAARPRAELVSQRSAQPLVTTREPAQPLGRLRGPLHEAPRNAATEAPDVQVLIGRIEVLAVQPQAPAAPAPRRPRTTSLANYLAGRTGG